MVYAQAEGHNEQQGFPGWAAGRAGLVVVRSIQRVMGALTGHVSTQGQDATHFFSKQKTRELNKLGVPSPRKYAKGKCKGHLT